MSRINYVTGVIRVASSSTKKAEKDLGLLLGEFDIKEISLTELQSRHYDELFSGVKGELFGFDFGIRKTAAAFPSTESDEKRIWATYFLTTPYLPIIAELVRLSAKYPSLKFSYEFTDEIRSNPVLTDKELDLQTKNILEIGSEDFFYHFEIENSVVTKIPIRYRPLLDQFRGQVQVQLKE